MAITIVKNAPLFAPAFNDVWLEVSTNNSASGFRFFVEIKDATTNAIIATGLRYPKRPNLNSAVFNVKDILQSLVKHVDIEGLGFVYINGGLTSKYRIEVGEEYFTQWVYTDYQWNGTTTIYNGYTKLVSSNAHTFSVGDQIRIRQNDGGALKPQLETLCEIVEIPNTTSVVVNIPWVGSGGAIGGAVTYADERKTLVKNLANSGTRVAYLGNFPKQLFEKGLYSNIFQNSGVVKFGTVSHEWYTYGDFFGYANFYNFKATPQPTELRGVNNLGVQLYSEIASYYQNNSLIFITSEAASYDGTTGDIFEEGTEWIDYWLEDASGTRVTEKLRVWVKGKGCLVNRRSIIFADRLGSWIPFDFTLVEEYTTEVTTETILNVEGRTEVVGATESNSWLLRTDILSENELLLFNELMASPRIKILVDYFYLDAEIVNRNTTTAKNKTMRRKEIVIRLATTNEIPV